MIVRAFIQEAPLIGNGSLRFFTAEHVTSSCVSWYIRCCGRLAVPSPAGMPNASIWVLAYSRERRWLSIWRSSTNYGSGIWADREKSYRRKNWPFTTRSRLKRSAIYSCNFARLAVERGRPDFHFSIVNVCSRLGVSFQHISKLRQRLVEKHVISQTAAAKSNSAAARFAWRL